MSAADAPLSTGRPRPVTRRAATLIAAGGLAALGGPVACAGFGTSLSEHPGFRRALRTALGDEASAAAYAGRWYAPIWLTAEGALNNAGDAALAALDQAADYGLSAPGLSEALALRAAPNPTPAAAGRLEGVLSVLFADFAARLRAPPASEDLLWTNLSVRPERLARPAIIQALAAAPRPETQVAELVRVHPRLEALASVMRRLRRRQAGLPFDTKTAPERAVALNLARLRALPPGNHHRHIVINIPSATLHAYEGARMAKVMRVVVGAPATPTPRMAGAIEYAVLNPYWNIPQDLLRARIAPTVLKGGAPAFHSLRLEALSDWSKTPRTLDPSRLDWRAVAAGERRLRVRQKPGADNMMGRVKFMLPNDLGIYLHDTPDKALFTRQDRALSAGCVRLEDPEALFGWLFGRPLALLVDGSAEQPVALHPPVPVYFLYQTVTASPERVDVWPDLYGLDAQAAGRRGATGAPW